MECQVKVLPKADIDQLSEQFCREYADIFSIDTVEQKQKVEDSIEECLTHLEEYCDALELFRQNGSIPNSFFQNLTNQTSALDKLSTQIDALEQYTYVACKLLDSLEQKVKDLEIYKRQLTGSKIKHLIGSFSKLSFGLDQIRNKQSESPNLQVQAKISDTLSNVYQIQVNFTDATNDLRKRMDKYVVENDDEDENELTSSYCNLTTKKVDDDDVLKLGHGDSNIDSSWQELI